MFLRDRRLREPSIDIYRAEKQEAALSTTGTCPINFQRDGARRFCGNIYYSVSRDRLHSTLTHHTRDLLVTMAHGVPRNSQRVPDPSFPDQKAPNARNF